jgi:hypothetical protein
MTAVVLAHRGRPQWATVTLGLSARNDGQDDVVFVSDVFMVASMSLMWWSRSGLLTVFGRMLMQT